MLLVHSVDAATSAFEMRPLFERAAGFRSVYALDLPGFGASERGARNYDVRLFVGAILDLLELIAMESGEAAIDVVALCCRRNLRRAALRGSSRNGSGRSP